MGLAILAGALVDKTADRDQPLAIAEHDIDKDLQLLDIRLDIGGVDDRAHITEVGPGVEVDDVVDAHDPRLQHRADHGQVWQT